MKKTAYILSLAVGFGTVTACSGQHDRNDRVVQAAYDQQNLNPTNDPDIAAGIERQRREYEARQQNLNPTNDPDIAAGIEQQQREYEARQEAARQAEEVRQEAARQAENFRLDTSGQDTKGYPPPKQ